MEKRVISTKLQDEDIKIEKSLRPMYFDDYIGQKKIKDNLKIYIEAAKSEERRWTMCFFMDHRDLERQHLPG